MSIHKTKVIREFLLSGVVRQWSFGLCVLVLTVQFAAGANQYLDRIDIGVAESENAHNLAETGSLLVHEADKALGEPGRRLIARDEIGEDLDLEEDWHGGWLAFDIKVAPDRKNYVTFKFWGSERPRGGMSLMLDPAEREKDNDYHWIAGGDAPGSGHRLGGAVWEPRWTQRYGAPFPDRWIYRTIILPLEITGGNEEIRLRAQQVSRGSSPAPTLYSVYTHTDPHFVPPADESQGEPFEWGKVKEKSESFTLEKLRAAAEEHAENVVENDAGGIHDVVRVYNAEWSEYYQDERLIERAAAHFDNKTSEFYQQGAPMSRWAGWGRGVARPYTKLHEGFAAAGILDEAIQVERVPENVTRREAYTRVFKEEFDAFHKRRRGFTNQTYYGNAGLYFLNRALQQLKPEIALTEAEARWFVYEIFGMAPFGPDQSEGLRRAMEMGVPTRVMTDRGFTTEWGFVGGYGEMTEAFAQLAGDVGCPLLKERISQAVKARVHVRRPDNTDEGYRTMRTVDVFSWRVRNYPGRVRYGNSDALTEAAILQDPISVRLAELYLEHHGEFRNRNPIENYEKYKAFKELPSSEYRLPIEEEHADYAWADEQNGVFMVRHGDSFLYGNVYFGFDGEPDEGRLRYVTPRMDRVVDLKIEGRVPDAQGDGPPPVPGTDITPPSAEAASTPARRCAARISFSTAVRRAASTSFSSAETTARARSRADSACASSDCRRSSSASAA